MKIMTLMTLLRDDRLILVLVVLIAVVMVLVRMVMMEVV